MTKKEKIIAICAVLSMLLLIYSAIYTIYKNKPKDSIFTIEKIYNNIYKSKALI